MTLSGVVVLYKATDKVGGSLLNFKKLNLVEMTSLIVEFFLTFISFFWRVSCTNFELILPVNTPVFFCR